MINAAYKMGQYTLSQLRSAPERIPGIITDLGGAMGYVSNGLVYSTLRQDVSAPSDEVHVLATPSKPGIMTVANIDGTNTITQSIDVPLATAAGNFATDIGGFTFTVPPSAGSNGSGLVPYMYTKFLVGNDGYIYSTMGGWILNHTIQHVYEGQSQWTASVPTASNAIANMAEYKFTASIVATLVSPDMSSTYPVRLDVDYDGSREVSSRALCTWTVPTLAAMPPGVGAIRYTVSAPWCLTGTATKL